MFNIKIDNSYNIVFITFKKIVDAQQAKKAYQAFQRIAPDFKNGFKVLTDLSLLEKMDIDSHPYIEKIMELCNNHGVAKVVRVIPDFNQDIGFNIMSLFNYSPKVTIVTCKSREEALKQIL